MTSRGARWLATSAIVFSLGAGVTGLDWGLPYIWHPDEKVELASSLVHDRSLDPGYFINPSLHIYAVAAAVWIAERFVPGHLQFYTLAIVPLTDPGNPNRAIQFWAHRLARGLSVLFAVGAVWWLWRSLRTRLGEWPAALSTAALGGSLGLMNFAHFATPDACLIFWTVGALDLFVRLGESGRTRTALAAGLLFGFACSTKYYGVLLAVPLGWSLVPIMREHGVARALRLGAMAGAAGVLAFFATTPYALIHWSTFVTDGLIFTWETGAPTDSLLHVQRSWGFYGGHLANAFGWPMFVLAIGSGVIWAFRPARAAAPQFVLSVHAIWIAAFWGFLGLSPHNAMRFIMPVAPSLATFAGWGTGQLLAVRGPVARRFARAAVVAVFVYSAAYTSAGVYLFVRDTRYAAGAWLKRHVEWSAGVCYFAIESYLPFFDRPRFQVKYRSDIYPGRVHDADFDVWRRQTFTTVNDVIVDTSLFYQRFYDEPDKWPGRVTMYRDLFAGTDPAGYRLVAKFEPRRPWWLAPDVELVSPTVAIFAKSGQIRD